MSVSEMVTTCIVGSVIQLQLYTEIAGMHNTTAPVLHLTVGRQAVILSWVTCSTMTQSEKVSMNAN